MDGGLAPRPEDRRPRLATVDYRLVESDGRWSLKVVLDRAWLDSPDRVYPVRVDPSVDEHGADNGDSFVQNTWPNGRLGDDELKVGSYDSSTNRAISYLKFDHVTSQLKNRYIHDVDLGLFNVSSAAVPRG
ncbi:RHS repeat-associated protein OS=Streptomyces griseomycini OX=66895 GN=FHS37_001617 PE=4 SV=1 [Streptomyces griseomycini]